MYPTQRREILLTLLAQHGFVSIRDLALQLNVSEITVRRDLKALHDQGRVEKVLGGGQVVGSAQELTFTSKRVLQQAEKEWIAKKALTLIEPKMTIGLTAGTTTWTLAKQIRGFQELTFVTNSTNVAEELKSNNWNDILLTGGQFRTPSDALVGPLAELTARQLRTDILFMGVHGIDLAGGVSTPNLLEAAVNRVLMERTKRIVLIFDHTKWGIEALAHVANLDEVDALVTDAGGGNNEMDEARQLGVEVFVAGLSD